MLFRSAVAYHATFAIPKIHTNLLYDRNQPVTSFAATSLPPQSPVLSFAKPDLWFTSDPPHTDLSTLLNRPIPHPYILSALKKISDQKWFDGCTSVCDRRFDEGNERFPLCALQLWLDFAEQARAQDVWKAVLSWVTKHFIQTDVPSDEAVFQETKTILPMLPWNTNIYGNNCTIANLTELLGCDWISSDVLDLGIDTL